MACAQVACRSYVQTSSWFSLDDSSRWRRSSPNERAAVCLHLKPGSTPLPASLKLTRNSSRASKHSLVSTNKAIIAALNGNSAGRTEDEVEQASLEGLQKVLASKSESELAGRVLSGELTLESTNSSFRKLREFLLKFGQVGRSFAHSVAVFELKLEAEKAKRMPEAQGNANIMIGEAFFIPLYDLYMKHGNIFRLTFGPKSFVIISDPEVAKRLLKDNCKAYSKGILAEILEFIMGKGLIPAEEEIWRVRRRAIVPALHRKYVSAMVALFGRATANLCKKLDAAARDGEVVEMESLFSRLTLDIIGKAVFNYDFDSLSYDTGIVEAVYVALREAEKRSIEVIPYWNIPIIKYLFPRQRKVASALQLINKTLDDLIANCKRMVEEESVNFSEEYMNERDPSILHFLLASGDDVSSKQLRDDLMTLLIAGHETSAAVLTWAFYLLVKNPALTTRLQCEVDVVLGDRLPTVDDMKKLKLTTRVINETLRLYPQPPVLIRRSLQDDVLGRYHIKKGEDIFISVWNLHRSPHHWDHAEEFRPERWPLDGPNPTEVTENYRYLPFGGGPRKCVGDIFATFENITAVAMLVQRFNFELAAGVPPVGMTTGATIHTTDGLRMTVTRRTKTPMTLAAKGAISDHHNENGSF